jgi:hypothetical protein
MSTLKLTDGDLAVENNALVLLTDPTEETAQRLTTKFKFFLGEWAFDPRVGLPLWERVFVKNLNLVAVRAMYREAILDDPNVDSLVSLSLDFDRALRKLTLSFEAVLLDGENLVFEDFILRENL